VLAGYSFGSIAATTAAPKLKNLGGLVLVALPLKMADGRALNNFAGPIAIAAGDGDMYCPVPQLEALHKELGSRAQLRIVEGADHFFGGYEVELADAIESMLATI
jgi:alpha/beta superfamily hydrolase